MFLIKAIDCICLLLSHYLPFQNIIEESGRRGKKNWKNMNDEGKKWGNKELGVLFVFVFATSPQTILSYDLRKRDINISKIFSFKWDLDVISYGAKQGTTMKINLVKTITINSPV